MEHTGEQASGEEPTTLPAGTKLGKYELIGLLGSGGMGSVYEAVHLGIGKRVAIKTLNPQVAAIPGARARFLREAELTSKVQHPHIVDVTDMGTELGHTFIVMELLKGEDLAHRLAREGRLSPADISDVLLPVASAVHTAHVAGIIHRDLKPQNIFLSHTAGGISPTVLDFGISKQSDAQLTAALTTTGAMVGTPYYLSPEQIEDARGAGPASDQYALGVILYECLAGRRPFEGESLYTIFNAIVQGQKPPLATVRPDVSPELAAIIDRAMHRQADARFASVAALGRALLPHASTKARLVWENAFAGVAEPELRATATRMLSPSGHGLTPPVTGSTFGGSVTDVRPSSRGKTVALAVAAALAAGGAVAVLASRSPNPATPAAAPAPTPPAAVVERPAPSAPPAAPTPEPAPAPEPSPAEPPSAASAPRASKPERSERHKKPEHGTRPARPEPAAPTSGSPSRAPNPNGAPVLE